MDRIVTQDAPLPDDGRRRAGTVLLSVVALGAVTQWLFWRTTIGLNFWIWDLLSVATCLSVFRRGTIRPTAWGAAMGCVLLGFSILRYASDWTLATAIPVNLVLLSVLPILVRDGLSVAELGSLPWRLVASMGLVPHAAIEAVGTPGRAVGGRGRSLLTGVARGLLFGVPTAGLFVLLLSSDPNFARALERAKDELGEGGLFVLCSLLSSAGYLFTHSLHTAARSAGAALGIPIHRPYRALDQDAAGARASSRVSTTTWAVVIGQVALVFALFVAANFRHLFGGHALVRGTGTLTYASYLHAGFAQLLVATILSVCLVLAGHGLLRPRGTQGGNDGGSPIPGSWLLTLLEATLLILTGFTLASCWQRLQIYEEVYGASHLRLGVAMVEVAVLGGLALTLAKVVFRRWRGYAGAMLVFATAMAVFASAINADRYVAATNLDRAARGRPLDVAYLLSLSRDARDVLAHPIVQADPELAARLEERFCGGEAVDLRAMRGLGQCPARPR